MWIGLFGCGETSGKYKGKFHMKKSIGIAIITLVSSLCILQLAFAFDYKTTVSTVGFRYEFQLSNYVKMLNAGNSEGISEAKRFAEDIPSGSFITVDRIIFDNDEVLVAKFIIDGHKKMLHASMRKSTLIPPSNAADNSATDAILGKKLSQ